MPKRWNLAVTPESQIDGFQAGMAASHSLGYLLNGARAPSRQLNKLKRRSNFL